MYGLKRLLEIEKERKERKAEKERKKKEKEEALKAEKRLKRIKRLRHKQNQRYYAKKKKERENERQAKGDDKAYRMILIVKNHKRVKRLGCAWWKTEAYRIYNEALEKNHQEVKFPVKFRTHEGASRKNNKIETKWELIIVERIGDDDINVTKFRNEDGKFVDAEIVDNKLYKIIAKDEWFVEEHFHVYGYHPMKDRKTYSFILDKLILEKYQSVDDVIRLNTIGNKLIISYSEDFDFVVCKNPDEAERLYSTLQRDDRLNKFKKIVFLGKIVGDSQISSMYNKIEEKTGWDRGLVTRNTVI